MGGFRHRLNIGFPFVFVCFVCFVVNVPAELAKFVRPDLAYLVDVAAWQ